MCYYVFCIILYYVLGCIMYYYVLLCIIVYYCVLLVKKQGEAYAKETAQRCKDSNRTRFVMFFRLTRILNQGESRSKADSLTPRIQRWLNHKPKKPRVDAKTKSTKVSPFFPLVRGPTGNLFQHTYLLTQL